MGIFDFLKKNTDDELLVGKSITWKESINIIFRIIYFDRNGTVINKVGSVKTKSVFEPYGFLIVENPAFSKNVKLPILHKNDFLLADSIFGDPNFCGIENTKDFLVTYRPQKESSKGLIGINHGLHYSITPYGTLKRYFDKYGNDKNLSMLDNIFLNFSWENELRVNINLTLDI